MCIKTTTTYCATLWNLCQIHEYILFLLKLTYVILIISVIFFVLLFEKKLEIPILVGNIPQMANEI